MDRPVMEGWWFVVLSSTLLCHMALWDISDSVVQFWHGNGNLQNLDSDLRFAIYYY